MTNKDRVVCVSFTNPFSFALELAPARGDALWWDISFSFNQKHFPRQDRVFSDASIVMIPKFGGRERGWEFEDVDLMMELYGDYIRNTFVEKDESEAWSLWVRRRPTGQ